MPAGLEVRIHGLREVRQILQRMPARVQRRLLGNAVRAQARVVQRAVAAAAPRGDPADRSPASARYGPLAESVRVVRLRRGVGDEVAAARVDLGPPRSRAFWGYFLEFGTLHMAASPWFRPAVESSAMRSWHRLRDNLARGVSREAVKLAGEFRVARRLLR